MSVLGARVIRTEEPRNAAVDAVSYLGVRCIDMPATPERVWAAVQEAK